MSLGSGRRRGRKAVGYIGGDRRLLVFTHDDFPLDVTGVQVSAGTIGSGEQSAAAVLREVWEETGVAVRILRALSLEQDDMLPSRPELHGRHVFRLAPRGDSPAERWGTGKSWRPPRGAPQPWTSQWILLELAHVLCAGFGARLGEIVPEADDGMPGEAG